MHLIKGLKLTHKSDGDSTCPYNGYGQIEDEQTGFCYVYDMNFHGEISEYYALDKTDYKSIDDRKTCEIWTYPSFMQIEEMKGSTKSDGELNGSVVKQRRYASIASMVNELAKKRREQLKTMTKEELVNKIKSDIKANEKYLHKIADNVNKLGCGDALTNFYYTEHTKFYPDVQIDEFLKFRYDNNEDAKIKGITYEQFIGQ